MFFLSRCSDTLQRDKFNPAPGLEEMIDDDDLASLQRVLSGEHSNIFVAGDIHNHTEAWTMILLEYQIWETFLGVCSSLDSGFSPPF